MARLIEWLFHALSRLPLGLLQGLGAGCGRLIYLASPRFAARLKSNLARSQIVGPYQDLTSLVKQCAAETGKGAFELAIAWCAEPDAIARQVRRCDGWEHVEAALSRGDGVVFVTPHLGSYDIAGRYLSTRLPFPLTAMYRPPKIAWLEPLMNAGRARGQARTAPANAAGVRLLVKALKQGEATIILPDQVPGNGEGVWAPFFGQAAYTMTLVARLAQLRGVTTLFFTGERLPRGEGFAVKIEPPAEPFTGDKDEDAARLNRMIEAMIRRHPAQYLWSYNRYKRPAGVPAPPTGP